MLEACVHTTVDSADAGPHDCQPTSRPRPAVGVVLGCGSGCDELEDRGFLSVDRSDFLFELLPFDCADVDDIGVDRAEWRKH